MPELPEVETTVRGLKKEVVGLKILDVWTDLNTKDIRKSDTVANPVFFKKFQKEVKNKKILSVERRAKNILINIEGGKTILVHMKMTGRLLITNHDKFVHVIFYLSNKKKLAFSDPRKFGKITLLDSNKMHTSKHLSNLGPEPLEKTFNLEKLKERLGRKQNGKIKTVLMDPSVIVGIGNIYSDEILWHAGVNPKRMIKKVSEQEFRMIFQSIKKLLTKGIDFGGDSMSDYVNIYGEKGAFQMHHMAYQRKGQKCMKKGCGGVIIREMIGGRSAHFCFKHQK